MALHHKGGELPEFGAIFMSSRTTKKECLERKLFGLPLACADFVKNVRAGMILFLFEYAKRTLYGVFEAVSDGQMDIVPHAFRSSGKFFPAQVRIRVLWNCRPLPEDGFRDAIRDNYYEAHKFKFGLSKEQVHKLLLLFDFKRIELQKAPVEKMAKQRHSRSSTTRNLAIDSGEAGRKKALLSAARISSPQKPTVCGAHDKFTWELESDTHTACPLGSSSFSIHRQGKLQEEIKHADISPAFSVDLGDYIPLCSPECCDVKVNINAEPCVKALYSDSPDKRTSTFSCLKLCLPSAAQENEGNSRTMEQYSSELKHADLLPKVVQQVEEKVFEADESVSGILENLEQRHNNHWMKISKRGHTKSFENRNTSVSQRTSVFSRLSFASESAEQKKKVSVFSRLNFESQVRYTDRGNTSTANSGNCVKDVPGGSNKRRHDVYLANNDNGQCASMRFKVNMLEKEHATTDDLEDSPNWGKIQKETSLLNFDHPCKMLKTKYIRS